MGIVSAFTGVWTEIFEFLVTMFAPLMEIFYVAETGLTFIGVMAVIGVGISLALLIWNLVRSFFPMRG